MPSLTRPLPATVSLTTLRGISPVPSLDWLPALDGPVRRLFDPDIFHN